jgi:hypothetical protein
VLSVGADFTGCTVAASGKLSFERTRLLSGKLQLNRSKILDKAVLLLQVKGTEDLSIELNFIDIRGMLVLEIVCSSKDSGGIVMHETSLSAEALLRIVRSPFSDIRLSGTPMIVLTNLVAPEGASIFLDKRLTNLMIYPKEFPASAHVTVSDSDDSVAQPRSHGMAWWTLSDYNFDSGATALSEWTRRR